MKFRWRQLVELLGLFLLGLILVRITSPARITITWETASEVEAAGFQLYRSTADVEDYARISEELIIATGDPLVGATYQYTDTEVTWGERYRYQLEEVTLTGNQTRYPDTVNSRAGLGWGWAIGVGALLALLGLVMEFWFPALAPESA
ncbi:MAG: hypothetical protein U9Q70_00950 [Chloroflexota bacterium]|nr:hypothetical protein [Chloroflexota bacterium]